MQAHLIDPSQLMLTTMPVLTVVQRHDKLARMTPPHRHSAGQLLAAINGLLTIVIPEGQWVVPVTHVVWLPPHQQHGFRSHGPFHGWSVYLREDVCASLPLQPRTMQLSGLLRETVNRAAQWPRGELLENQQRIMAVMLDEIASLPAEPFELPMPQDPRLIKVAHGLLSDLANKQRMDQWAHWAGMSPRTLGRRFIAETGYSFSHWRQRARFMRALEMLAEKIPVTHVALDVGYENLSAFIDQFQRVFGVTPGKYFPVM
ncbi:helix-turn-helix transcriptional regulator [Yersinia sp. 1652 StPb PI]|uniref:AraC family transcriptional regulator n=1 Tax=Yersinia sp. 1652 StPb PI TaxID=3061649 RepID=UPI00355B6497